MTVSITEQALREILLVQALEEAQATELGEDDRSAAALSALGARSDEDILSRRAAYLCRCLPSSIKAWLFAGGLPAMAWAGISLLCFLLGLFANYLGPAGQFHIVYNPVSVLLLWNLLAYLLLGLERLRRRPALRVPVYPADSASMAKDHSPERPPVSGNWWLRHALPGLWRRYLALRHGIAHTREQARRWSGLGQRYLALYLQAAGPLVSTQLRMVLHLSALTLSLGALAGLYLQGLFIEYHAVWRSTFISEPETIRGLLDVLLAPALWALDGQGLAMGEVMHLLAPEGAAASVWLHRLALMTGFVVLLPRAVLAGLARRRARRLAAALRLDLTTAYFEQILGEVRSQHIDRIRHGMADEIRGETAVLAESLADFVHQALFVERIRPELEKFRRHGGRLIDLEQAIEAQADAFAPILDRHLQEEQAEFGRNLQTRLYALIGREFAGLAAPGLRSEGLAPTQKLGGALGNAVAADLGGAIGLVVATTVSAAIASISGGIGKSIGIAVLSHLLGTSGPVGLLLGAALGLAGGGALYVVGKDALRERLRHWRTPAPVARMALRDTKLTEAGAEIAATVKAQVEAELAPMTERIIDALLAQLPQQVAASTSSRQV